MRVEMEVIGLIVNGLWMVFKFQVFIVTCVEEYSEIVTAQTQGRGQVHGGQ